MIEIKYLVPEIFLSISIFSLLLIGVFIQKSFNTIYKLSSLVILSLVLIVLTSSPENEKVFKDSIVIDNFSTFMKTLILVASFFILSMSKQYLVDIKNDKFE